VDEWDEIQTHKANLVKPFFSGAEINMSVYELGSGGRKEKGREKQSVELCKIAGLNKYQDQ